jgi:putative endonuclease
MSRPERQPCVYILASGENGTLYVGVTSDLAARLTQHRQGVTAGFTGRYGVHRLVHYEVADSMVSAIAREKQLKRWRRDWKRNLIERGNPCWSDLSIGLGLEPLPSPSGGAVDPGTGPGSSVRHASPFEVATRPHHGPRNRSGVTGED